MTTATQQSQQIKALKEKLAKELAQKNIKKAIDNPLPQWW